MGEEPKDQPPSRITFVERSDIIHAGDVVEKMTVPRDPSIPIEVDAINHAATHDTIEKPPIVFHAGTPDADGKPTLEGVRVLESFVGHPPFTTPPDDPPVETE